jgi:riboflavin synthase
MFTGLVKDVGRIDAIDEVDGGGHRLTIATELDTDDFEIGESIAVDGACLTVVRIDGETFSVDISPETREVTTLGRRDVGDGVHLERALRVGDRLGGHFVTGHIDAVGEVVDRRVESDCWELTLSAPPPVARYLLPKGSITVDGVSLTVNTVDAETFGLTIIPHTAEKTKLADYETGQKVNLEADLLGKYIDRLHGDDSPSAADVPESVEISGDDIGSRHDSG